MSEGNINSNSVRDEHVLARPNDLNEPLMGSSQSVHSSQGSRGYSDLIGPRKKQLEGLPDVIDVLKYMQMVQDHKLVATENLGYNIFEQAYFNLKTLQLRETDDIYEKDSESAGAGSLKLKKLTDHMETENRFPKVEKKKQIDKKYMQENPFASLFIKEKDKQDQVIDDDKNDFTDYSKKEKYLKKLLDTLYTEDAKKKSYMSVQKFQEDGDKWKESQISEIKDEIVNQIEKGNQEKKPENDKKNQFDEDQQRQNEEQLIALKKVENNIHRNLISQGSFDGPSWMLEVRKTLVKQDDQIDDQQLKTLKLEIHKFPSKSESNALYEEELIQFEGNEIAWLFNNNFECLFNHVQVKNKLYFFKVEEIEVGFKVTLKEVVIHSDSGNQDNFQSSDLFSFEVNKQKINDKVDNSKILGVTITQNIHQENVLVDDNQIPEFYYAIIYGQVVNDKKPIICYDIRHTSQKDKSKTIEILEKKMDSIKNFRQECASREFVLVNLKADQMLQQLLLTGDITREAYNSIIMKQNINEEVGLNIKQRNDFHRNKFNFIKDQIKSKMMKQVVKQKKKNINEWSDGQLHIFALGQLNEVFFENVYDFVFIQQDQKQQVFDKKVLMRPEDIQSLTQRIMECLQSLTYENTSSIIKFNSSKITPEVAKKVLCRSQFELIKRVIAHQNIQIQKANLATSQNVGKKQMLQTHFKSMKTTSEKELGLDDILNQKFFDDMNKKTKARLEIYQGLKKFRCTSLIDTIQRKMYMLVYHKKKANLQYQFIIQLPNLSLISQLKSATSDQSLNQSQLQPYGYNQMFMEVLKENNQNKYVQKFTVTKLFDNVMKGIDHVYWVNKGKLYKTDDPNWDCKPLRSRFQIMYFKKQDDKTKIDKKIDDRKSKDYFIYSFINYDQVNEKEKYRYDVKSFKSYSNQQDSINSQNDIIPEEIKFQFDDANNHFQKILNETVKKKQIKSKDEKDDNYDVDSFNFKGNYLILQNVITVEDDREEIPVVSIGDDLEGIQFAMIKGSKIEAITSLGIKAQTISESFVTKNNQENNYQKYVQLCASSDVQEGKSAKGKGYFFQDFTISIYFEKQERFRMYEYQVQWHPESIQTSNNQTYQIRINLIKLRDVIFKKNDNNVAFTSYNLVPLYETLETSDPATDDDGKIYNIVGTQLIMRLQDQSLCHINFKSQLDDKIYDTKTYDEINYKKRLIYSQTKQIVQHHFQGIYVETQFKHQRENDLTSDYLNSGIFNEWESYEILREANFSCLNSLPLDFLALMDHPDINHFWFQIKNSKSVSFESPLNTTELMNYNFKRFFSPSELLDGSQIFESYSLEIIGTKIVNSKFGTNMLQTQEKIITKRDPYMIKLLFQDLDKQEQDRFNDYKYLRDLRSPKFSLSLIESVLTEDQKVTRFRLFKDQGLLMDGKDVISTDLNQKSVIENPLQKQNNMMVDIYLNEVYESNQFTENKYSQMMRILPIILELEGFQSNQYFQFFEQQYDESNNENEDQGEKLNTSLDTLFLDKASQNNNIEKNSNMIQISQFFPINLQDQIDRYTDDQLQVFKASSVNSYASFKHSNSMDLAFNNLKCQYEGKGSKYEVLATNIDFRPYILGQKILQLSQVEDESMIDDVFRIRFDDYQLAVLIKSILLMTQGKIEDQKALRDIIDFQFKKTQKSYYLQFFFYAFFYCLPFWHQMTQNNYWIVWACNQSCLIVQLIFMFYEVVQMFAYGIKLKSVQKHFSFRNGWNWIDAINLFLYVNYYYYRMFHLTDDLVPSLPEEFKDYDSQSPSIKKKLIKDYFDHQQSHHGHFVIYKSTPLHVALIVISFFKLLSFLRCNEQFGLLVKLMVSCLYDSITFNLFFLANIFVFAKLQQILGIEIDEEEYPLIPQLAYYLTTLRTALGESEPPKYPFWEAMHKNDQDKWNWNFPMRIIYIIWIVWFFNLVINMILLLNFLIAIISQSYDRVISNRLINRYKHMSELNVENLQFHHAFRHFWKFIEYDMLQTVSCHTEDLTRNNQVNGLTFNLKIYIKQQLSQLREEMNRKISVQKEVTNRATQKVQSYMDDKFASQLDKITHQLQHLPKTGSNNKQDPANDDVPLLKQIMDKLDENVKKMQSLEEQNEDLKNSIEQLSSNFQSRLDQFQNPPDDNFD